MMSDVFFSQSNQNLLVYSPFVFSCFDLSTRHFATSLESQIRKNIKQRQSAEYYSNVYVCEDSSISNARNLFRLH